MIIIVPIKLSEKIGLFLSICIGIIAFSIFAGIGYLNYFVAKNEKPEKEKFNKIKELEEEIEKLKNDDYK
jgi:hypothetical protein